MTDPSYQDDPFVPVRAVTRVKKLRPNNQQGPPPEEIRELWAAVDLLTKEISRRFGTLYDSDGNPIDFNADLP